MADSSRQNDSRRKLVKICLDFGCLTVIGIPLLCLYFSGKPFRRGFYCDDTSIRYPFKESTISSGLLYVYAIGIPVIIISVVELVRYTNSVGDLRWLTGSNNTQLLNFLWITYNELVVWAFGALASQFCTDIAKYSIGRLRPHFLDICRPIGLDTSLCPPNLHIYRYVEDYECQNYESSYRVRDARLSFMSGHSSFSAYSMVFSAIYIQYRVKWQALSLLRPLVQMSLIYLAIYTGFSRISDYKHHWSDVLIGLIQGTLVAIITSHYVGRYFRRYPEKVRDSDRVTTYIRPSSASPSAQPPSPSVPLRSSHSPSYHSSAVHSSTVIVPTTPSSSQTNSNHHNQPHQPLSQIQLQPTNSTFSTTCSLEIGSPSTTPQQQPAV